MFSQLAIYESFESLQLIDRLTYFQLGNIKITVWRLQITYQYYNYVLCKNAASDAADTIAAAAVIFAYKFPVACGISADHLPGDPLFPAILRKGRKKAVLEK